MSTQKRIHIEETLLMSLVLAVCVHGESTRREMFMLKAAKVMNDNITQPSDISHYTKLFVHPPNVCLMVD